MNKNKLIKWLDEEIKREKAVLGNDGCFVGEVKGTLLGRIQEAERIKEFIQSEPEDVTDTNVGKIKNNFDVITESPEKLAESIFNLAVDYLDECDFSFEDYILKWLNEKAGK